MFAFKDNGNIRVTVRAVRAARAAAEQDCLADIVLTANLRHEGLRGSGGININWCGFHENISYVKYRSALEAILAPVRPRGKFWIHVFTAETDSFFDSR